ncbi:ComEC/Rec2 family competence protein [Demequina sp. NBRC 110057]|uniref:ComEC/Rec2 family competence protein n=1 Tax=Demequina sp. NBRC 110057 TaxID=1570346 RepID=UPI000A019113|nr:ComEC/Rec2 family competence protein [Demequina sp. NBRC 110057]
MTPRHDARLVSVAGGAWCGAALAVVGPPGGVARGVFVALVIAVGALVAAAWGERRSPTTPWWCAWAAALGLACAGAAAAATTATLHDGAANHAPADAVQAGTVRLTGTVTAPPRAASLRGTHVVFVEVRLSGWTRDAGEPEWHPAEGTATVVLARGEVERDDVIEVAADLTEDDEGEAIAWDAVLVTREATDGGPLAESRRWVALHAARLPETTGGLVRGMLTGDTSAMPESQVAAMRVAGLAHLTAVSGAHFAVVTMVVLLASGWVRAGRAVRAVSVGAAALVFAAFVGLEPSVARAVVMALVVACALAAGRRARGLPALSVAVVGVSLVSPDLTLRQGFIMSVVAVAAIVLWAPALARRLARVLAPRAARAVAVPITAQAALTPLLLLLQPGVSMLAVPANLVVVPFLAPLTVTGLLAAGIGPWWPAAGHALLEASAIAAWPVARVADAVAALPGATLAWPSGATGMSVAIAAVVAGIVATVAHTRRSRVAAGVAAAALVAGALAPGLRPVSRIEDWSVVACDVGQGDMMLVRAGPQAAVVVDTGPEDELAVACLDRYGVTEVPLMVLTHPHADHDSGAAAVATAVPVAQAWVAAIALDGEAARDLRGQGVPVVVPALGATSAVGEVGVEVLSTRHLDPDEDNVNDASIVTRLTVDAMAVLTLGDLEPDAQRELATRGGPQDVGVVKIAHHGSRFQDEGLAADITADVGVVSAGADNDYGHPARAALDLYDDRVGALAVTATCGDVVITADASGTAAARCRGDVGP